MSAAVRSAEPPNGAVVRVYATGAIALAVTPYRPSSIAAMIVIEAIPAFAAP